MPPKYSAQERQKLIERVILGKEPVSKVCREAGISRVLFYRWLKKYRQAGERVEALAPGKKKPPVSPRKVTPKQEEQILAIIKEHPQWSTKKISVALPKDPSGKPIVGNHGVQNTLQRLDLSTKEKRTAYVKEISKPKEKVLVGVRLTPEQKLEMLERVVIGKEKVSKVCQEYGISRTLFYRLKKRYEEAALEERLRAVSPQARYIERYWRQTPERYEQAVLNLVVEHPEYSVRRIVRHLPEVAGVPIVGHHGVQNILRRHNLSLYEQRLAYSQAQITPVTRLITTAEQVFARLFVFPPETRAAIVRFFSVAAFSAFSTVAVLGILGYFVTITAEIPVPSRIGLFFATIALSVGSIFFAYSMKYYLTLAIVLSFSRQPLEEGGGFAVGLNGRLNGRLNNNHRNNRNGDGWLARIFGLMNGPTPSETTRDMIQAGGLQPSLDHIKLKRHPFVSIHLPFYNEKKVAERILAACVSMDYPNYEIIVCDDSTDKTIKIVQRYAKEHNQTHPKGPKIKVLHRPTRQGFKGGALAYALKHTNPKTEFVVVFDADFIPYPDTLELFIKYFKANNNNLEDYKKSNIAVVGGYQWHVLNKSENWVTRGVRTEYAGSYVIERPGREILGLLRQISGSVYMIRADVLKKIGWGTSITEDFQLTLKLYEQGYKVIYTPYIQGPAECVSTLKRLIRQRMRWAEGHSNCIKKMFVKLMLSPKLTPMEKLEVLYISPYYLQAFFFLVGTLSWLMAETVFRARLPFWTSLWGWSLVLTNFFSLPLVNAVGLFLEESEERDYLGLLSFVALSYIMVPFQAYASVKGFLEKEEGPWFRTPKTGKITDIFTRGKFYRWLTGIIPGRRPAPAVASVPALPVSEDLQYANKYLALATANNQFNSFKVKPKRLRWVSKVALVVLLMVSITILNFAQGVEVLASDPPDPSGTFNLDSTAPSPDLLSANEWRLLDNTNGGDSTSTQVPIDHKSNPAGWYQYAPAASNGTAESNTGCSNIAPDGRGWIFSTAFGSGGKINSNPWTFYFSESDNDSADKVNGHLDVCVWRVTIVSNSIDTYNIIYDSQTDGSWPTTETWDNAVNQTGYTTGTVSEANFGNNEYLYVEYFSDVTTVTSTAAPATYTSTFRTGNTYANPRIITPTVKIPENVIFLIAAAPFIPMMVLWMKKRRMAVELLGN